MVKPYAYAESASDLKGIRVMSSEYTRYKKLAESIADKITEIEEIKGDKASDELYEKYLEAESNSKNYRSGYDIAYRLFKLVKENADNVPYNGVQKVTKVIDNARVISGLQTNLEIQERNYANLKAKYEELEAKYNQERKEHSKLKNRFDLLKRRVIELFN